MPGAINIYGSNVTVKDTLADDPDRGQAIYSHSSATGTVVEDATIRSQSASAPVSNAILGGAVTVLRVDIHWAVEGVEGGGDLIKDSYGVSDGQITAGHNEPIDVDDGTSQLTQIEHDTLLDPLGETTAVIVGGPWGGVQNVTIDGNLMGRGRLRHVLLRVSRQGAITPSLEQCAAAAAATPPPLLCDVRHAASAAPATRRRVRRILRWS